MNRSTLPAAARWFAVLVGLLHSPRVYGHELEKPVPILETRPVWPPGVNASHDVVVPVLLTISTEGTVTQVEVEASLGPDFDQAAVAAAEHWTFKPAQHDGIAVASKVRAVVRFRAETPEASPISSAPVRESAASTPDLAGVTEPVRPVGHGEQEHAEVRVIGDRVAPPRSASEAARDQAVIQAAPHRTGGDLLQVLPGVFITQHSGQGKAYQVFYRGFDAVHGQDLEFWVGGAPVNEVSNIHGQGYADLHFVMPEVVSRITMQPGNYNPEQGDFAVAGTVRYDLGYREPGITLKVTQGSFGEQRAFLAYHRENSAPGSFAAFEAQSTNGFGPARAAKRASGIVQQVVPLGDGQLRLLATAYAGTFQSPGVVRLGDIESGKIARFGTYGIDQGGYSSRYQVVTEYREVDEHGDWSVAPYAIQRGLELKQNYTGYLIDEINGDTTQLLNESTTLGLTGHYRHAVHDIPLLDSIEAGMSARNDWIAQSQRDIGVTNAKLLATIVDAKIRATDVAGWADLALAPVAKLKIRAGMRIDQLAFNVQDNTPAIETRAGADPNAFARSLRPVSPGGQVRTAAGTHFGPRATLDYALLRGTHAVLSYGEGFRSPQARSLGNGERAPFTTVRSMEAGLRYATGSITASLSGFRTTLNNDLVFDAATTRNEAVPASERAGGALEFVMRPVAWFVSSGSGTYTRAVFTESDTHFHSGDRLPYVPEIIIREDLAFLPTLGHLLSRPLTARIGTSLTGMFDRPQPYGQFGHDVVLVDAIVEMRLNEVALGVDIFNVLDTRWYDSEFTYSANFTPNATARLVPERYVTVGAPRTILGTLSLFVD